MGNCNSCNGNCGGCGGCAATLELTQAEIELLRELGQYSFLPVARKADNMTPVYREETDYSEAEYSLFIELLEKKQLIYLDYTPLPGADMAAYAGYPVHGSMGLTKRGQDVLDLLEKQGVEE